MKLTEKIAECRKAVAALVVAPLVLLGLSLLDASPAAGAVTAYEWVGIALAGVTGSTAVWATPNAAGRHEATA